MASMALMLVTAYLMSEGKPYGWTFYPMIFMFITTVAALAFTSYRLFKAVFTGTAKGVEAYIGNTLMGLVAIFLVIAAIILAVEGLKAFGRYKVVRAEGAPAKA
jgi:carbon starvation protein CstA